MRVVAVAVVFLAGCIFAEENKCIVDKQADDEKLVAAPGAVLAVALAGCSTCDHSHVNAYWQTPGTPATGDIEIQLVPHCPVRDTTVLVPVTANPGVGTADNNWRNCGDVIDLDAYVTNRSDATLDRMSIQLFCPRLEE